MQSKRFDALATLLSTTSTRRRLLTLLTAVPLAGVLTKILEQEGAANRPGTNCRAHNHRHSGHRKDHRKRVRDQEDDEHDGDNNGGDEPLTDRPQEECTKILTAAGCTKDAVRWTCPPNTSLFFAQLSVLCCNADMAVAGTQWRSVTCLNCRCILSPEALRQVRALLD